MSHERQSPRPARDRSRASENAMGRQAKFTPDNGRAQNLPARIKLTDFWAFMPGHQYLYIPTRELWPASSVNGQLVWPMQGGKPIAPSKWLDQSRPIVQLAWHPGETEIIEGRVLQVAGWVDHPGVKVFNLYRPPAALAPERPEHRPDLWLDHVHRVYPDNAEHIIRWLAFKVQFPGVKLNHALVLGGLQGVGKDSLLEPSKHAVGPWNWQEINPGQMLGRFNGWAKSVIVRVSEARDLGDVDRFAFYDHSKTYITAPPDVIRVDEKNLREHYCANVCGLIVTTNHLTDGLYLPADDRRHYVAWSPCSREDFDAGYWQALYAYYENGGTDAVCRYLRGLDLGDFDPKAPPPKTPAFFQIVAAGESPEASEIRDAIEAMGSPDALVLDALANRARDIGLHALADELVDRKNRRSIPHRLERADYVRVANPDATDCLFKIRNRRQAVYARRQLNLADQIRAARGLT